MGMNGALRRGLALWMAWANISLPVPLSPVISTLLGLAAAQAAVSLAERNAGAVPFRSSKVNRADREGSLRPD